MVPAGKKWVLKSGIVAKIQVSNGTLESGTECNANFFSNPEIITAIDNGNYYNSTNYGIIFKDLKRVPYTNENTYEIIPISFVDKNFTLRQLEYKKPENVGVKELEFKAGTSVFVTTCLMSIELTEVNMTKQDSLNQNAIGRINAGSSSNIDTSIKSFKAPQFPGGITAETKFIDSNLHYPDIARQNNIQGIVTVNFVVDETGSIKDVNAFSDIGEACNDEAIRIVKLMPHWIPGEKNRQPASLKYSAVILFKLNSSSQKQ
jgi:TonB family protein